MIKSREGLISAYELFNRRSYSIDDVEMLSEELKKIYDNPNAFKYDYSEVNTEKPEIVSKDYFETFFFGGEKVSCKCTLAKFQDSLDMLISKKYGRGLNFAKENISISYHNNNANDFEISTELKSKEGPNFYHSLTLSRDGQGWQKYSSIIDESNGFLQISFTQNFNSREEACSSTSQPTSMFTHYFEKTPTGEEGKYNFKYLDREYVENNGLYQLVAESDDGMLPLCEVEDGESFSKEDIFLSSFAKYTNRLYSLEDLPSEVQFGIKLPEDLQSEVERMIAQLPDSNQEQGLEQ